MPVPFLDSCQHVPEPGLLFPAKMEISQLHDESSKPLNQIAFNIKSEEDGYGLQFDIFYDESSLLITPDHLQSPLSGIQIWSSFVKDGHMKVLMFSLSYDKIVKAGTQESQKFLLLSFTPINAFNGASNLSIKNSLLAGEFGKEIEINQSLDYLLGVNNPQKLALKSNFPNPFKKTTTIPYEVSNAGLIKINIFNSEDLLVTTLVEDYILPGYYIISWNGKDKLGQTLDSGRYTVEMLSDSQLYEESITITLLK